MTSSKTYDLIETIPLRDVVIFPGTITALFVGRNKSVEALERAFHREDKLLFAVTQRNPEQDNPNQSDLYELGTMVKVVQFLRLPDKTIKVLLEGITRAKLLHLKDTELVIYADVVVEETRVGAHYDTHQAQKVLLEQFQEYARLFKKIPEDVLKALETGQKSLDKMVDTMAANMELSIEQRQQILEALDIGVRVQRLMTWLELKIDLLETERKIRIQVKEQMDNNQKEYFLQEKIKAIQKEIRGLRKKRHGQEENPEEAEGEEDLDELSSLKRKLEEAGLAEEALKKGRAELKKLSMMPPQSSEATISRNYVDWLIEIPWKKRSKVFSDLSRAEKILDQHHYGLDKVKERILEYLAVQKRTKKLSGPILCLVGPPGVGKTSLARSIAEATNRKYVRMALGGVRDEAEIRGHRRTYIGAMPGKLMQNMAKAGTKNPLFLLDEIDKMGSDYRGDPAAALLEVLDAEQNHAFNDHYIEVDYDLSEVMFIATANSMEIPEALADRMEIIQLSGYTETEKSHIGLEHLWKKQVSQHGFKPGEVELTSEGLTHVIRHYTREAGVRALDRELAKLARKSLKDILTQKKPAPIVLDALAVGEYLGVTRYRYGRAASDDRVGQITGLAWTRVGGELLSIEVATSVGKGKLQRTGKLGDVMQESIEAALSLVRMNASILGLESDFYEKTDIHVHVPEGATPKDGPSAGIAMTTALVSSLTQNPVRADVAMTGEITLRGEVLPIGGLKEKLLAALRGGISHVVIPKDNEKDLEEIPEDIKGGLNIHPVEWIEEVLDLALVNAWKKQTLPLRPGQAPRAHA